MIKHASLLYLNIPKTILLTVFYWLAFCLLSQNCDGLFFANVSATANFEINSCALPMLTELSFFAIIYNTYDEIDHLLQHSYEYNLYIIKRTVLQDHYFRAEAIKAVL